MGLICLGVGVLLLGWVLECWFVCVDDSGLGFGLISLVLGWLANSGVAGELA